MDEAKRAGQVQGRLFRFLQQLVSERFIQMKKRFQQETQNQKLKEMIKYEGTTSDRARQLKMQHDVQTRPQDFHILYMEYGNARDFENRLKEQGIDYLKINPDIAEARGEGFIVSDDNYKILAGQSDIDIVHLYDIDHYQEGLNKLQAHADAELEGNNNPDLDDQDLADDKDLFQEAKEENAKDSKDGKDSKDKGSKKKAKDSDEKSDDSDHDLEEDIDDDKALDEADRLDDFDELAEGKEEAPNVDEEKADKQRGEQLDENLDEADLDEDLAQAAKEAKKSADERVNEEVDKNNLEQAKDNLEQADEDRINDESLDEADQIDFDNESREDNQTDKPDENERGDDAIDKENTEQERTDDEQERTDENEEISSEDHTHDEQEDHSHDEQEDHSHDEHDSSTDEFVHNTNETDSQTEETNNTQESSSIDDSITQDNTNNEYQSNDSTPEYTEPESFDNNEPTQDSISNLTESTDTYEPTSEVSNNDAQDFNQPTTNEQPTYDESAVSNEQLAGNTPEYTENTYENVNQPEAPLDLSNLNQNAVPESANFDGIFENNASTGADESGSSFAQPEQANQNIPPVSEQPASANISEVQVPASDLSALYAEAEMQRQQEAQKAPIPPADSHQSNPSSLGSGSSANNDYAQQSFGTPSALDHITVGENTQAVVAEDMVLNAEDGRSRDSLNKTVIKTVTGDATDEAKSNFRETIRYGQAAGNTIDSWGGTAEGLALAHSTFTQTLTDNEIQTLSKIMEGSGYKALNFSTATATEESLAQVQQFFSDNKLVKIDNQNIVTKVADANMQYGRDQFGLQGLRVNGQYVSQKGVVNTTTNFEFATKNMLKGSSKYNQRFRPGDARALKSEDVQQLIKKLTANNGANIKKIAVGTNTYLAGKNMLKGIGGQKSLLDKLTGPPTLSPFSLHNVEAQKALQQDETYQAAMRAPQMIKNAQRLAQGGVKFRSIISEHNAVRAKNRQLELERNIRRLKLRSQGNGQQTAKRIEELRRKARIEKTKYTRYTKQHKSSVELLGKWTKRKQARIARHKNAIKTVIRRIPGGNKALAAKAILEKVVRERVARIAAVKAAAKLAAKIAAIKAKIAIAIGAKLWPIVAAIAAAILQLMKFLVKVAIAMMIIDLIISLVQGNFDENDPRYQDYQNTIFGNIYDTLCDLEGGWAKTLKYDLFKINEEVPWIDDLDGMYAEFLPDGTPDWEHWHIDSETYLQDIVGTETLKNDANPPGFGNTAHDNTMAKGPEPFPNAPEEAYKWIRVLDGGVEVQFRGIGGGAGYMSNVREIMVMAMVSQASSNAVDMETETPEDHENPDTLWGKIHAGIKHIGEALKTFWNGLSNLFTRLLRTIPGIDDWFVQHAAEQRSKHYMLYCKPLFDYSHQEVYSLQLAIHPTQRTLSDFDMQSLIGDGEFDTGYNWGMMCSGIMYDEAADAHGGQDYRFAGKKYKIKYEGDSWNFAPEYHEAKGYGCMKFNQFAFKYDSDNDLYYNDELCAQVQPAWNIPVDGLEEDVCVAPGNDGHRWYQVTKEFGHADCWVPIGGGEYLGRYEVESEYDSAYFIDHRVGGNDGYCAIYSQDGGNVYWVNVMTNPQEEGTGTYDEDGHEITYTTYDVTKYAWQHSCQADHTGYYCGGHLKIIVTGCIYHMTDQQKMHNDELFEEKLIHEEEYGEYGVTPETSRTIYHKIQDKDDPDKIYAIAYVGGTDPLFEPEKQVLDSCKDLFDIDSSYKHKWGTVAIWSENDPLGRKFDFSGWEYDTINDATTKLEDDWEELYNIKPGNTIGGFYSGGGVGVGAGGAGGATGGSSNGLAVYLSSTEINVIMEQLDTTYSSDPSWPARRQAVLTALTYVGKIGYKKQYHGSALVEGGLNDCSGYVSQCWKDVLQQNYTTASFWTSGLPKTRWDGALKPGDIILHYQGGIADGVDDHALIYIGKDANGNDLSVDCTGSGTHLRSRGSIYYNQAYYIPMDQVLGL